MTAGSPTSVELPPLVLAHDEIAPSGMPPVAERISVAGTLLETSRLMTELLRFVAPEVHQRTVRLTRVVRGLVEELGVSQPWEFEVAARLSQIGRLALPSSTRDRLAAGESLSDEDEQAVASHPLIARDLLSEVRRLDAVREMVCRQREPYTVPGLPLGNRTALDRMTLGGQLLRVAADFDDLLSAGQTGDEAVAWLDARGTEYSADVLAALRRLVAGTTAAAAA
jgi:response regulator RpfG family c-di-GMP phosphodiesterase